MAKRNNTGFFTTVAKWVEGELRMVSQTFDNLADAIEHSLNEDGENYKIHDHNGRLVHSGHCRCHHHHGDDNQYA